MLMLQINNRGGIIISKSKIKVILIDDNVELCKTISSYLLKTGKFEILSVNNDGESGLKAIIDKTPDIVVLDILLPERDGISILEHCKHIEFETKPIFVMLTAIGQENITKKVLELGADYVILKPFNMDILAKRMVEQYESRGNTIENDYFIEPVKVKKDDHIIDVLQKIGIPINLKGYHYLKTAIKISIDDPKLLESITKLLYPEIAKIMETTPSRVERDIRHSLEVAWSKGNGQYYYDLLGYNSKTNSKPTNGAFISSMVEKLRSQLGY